MKPIAIDINKDNVFFTSDTHFSHVNIIKYCNRPFTDVDEHDETLISNWNNVVDKDDIVFHLGDVALGPTKRVHDILERLNGKIYLCIGNHDWRSIVKQQAWRFEEIHQQYNLRIGKRHVILNHFPFLCYSGSRRGLNSSYQLFGHVHTSPYTDKGLDYSRLDILFPSQYDVGVDNNNFTPVSWNDVNNIINAQMISYLNKL